MKNVLIFLTIIVCIVGFFLINTYYNSNSKEVSFNNISLLNPSITKALINNYFSNDESLKKSSQNIIKQIVLKDLNYDNWIEYLDYIEITIYPTKIYSDISEDLVITINLSKDTGIIAIYRLINDEYIFSDKIENLTYIKDIYSIKSQKYNRTFLIVEQVLDERLGAFFYDNYIQIFTKIDNSFSEVFRLSTEYTSYYYEKWSDSSIKTPKWYMIKEMSILSDISSNNDSLKIKVSKILKKYEGYNSLDNNMIPDNFQLIQEKQFDIEYNWSNVYKYFIIGVGTYKVDNTPVGIIEFSNHSSDSLLKDQDIYYKVIYKNGKIDYIHNKLIEFNEN